MLLRTARALLRIRTALHRSNWDELQQAINDAHRRREELSQAFGRAEISYYRSSYLRRQMMRQQLSKELMRG